MYWDYQGAYASSNQSLCPSTHSMNSFYTRTPPSTRCTSFDSVKLEDIPFSTANTPERYDTSSSMSSMSSSMSSSMCSSMCSSASSTTHDSVPEFPDQTKILPDQVMVGYHDFPIYNNEGFGPFQSKQGLPINTPALKMGDCSPVSVMEPSPVSMTFVVPSHTTFIDSFDGSSPITPIRPIQFESTAIDYNQDFSIGQSPALNLTNFVDNYEVYKSPSITASRPSTTSYRASTIRQPIFEPARSSAALQRIQAESQAVRQTRKRMKREFSVSGLMLPAHIRIQHAATKSCPWEGCDKKFKRQEHLKRHERIHTFIPDEDSFPCQFCPKKFNRSDNLKSHIWLHADPNKKNETRTKHWPAAMAVWQQMNGKRRKSRTENDVNTGEDVIAKELPELTIKTRSRVAGH